MRRVFCLILILIFSSSLSFASRNSVRKEKEKYLDILFELVSASLAEEALLFPLERVRARRLAFHSDLIKGDVSLTAAVLFVRFKMATKAKPPEYFHLRHAAFWFSLVAAKYFLVENDEQVRKQWTEFFIKEFSLSRSKLASVEFEICSTLSKSDPISDLSLPEDHLEGPPTRRLRTKSH